MKDLTMLNADKSEVDIGNRPLDYDFLSVIIFIQLVKIGFNLIRIIIVKKLLLLHLGKGEINIALEVYLTSRAIYEKSFIMAATVNQ